MIWLAFLLALAAPAVAAPTSTSYTCPTRPAGDNSNACATTAFVQTAVGGGGGSLALGQNHLFVGNASNIAADTVLAGDCVYTGSIVCTKTNGSAFTSLATLAPGTNIPAFLAVPSSANLAAALTDETGSGAAVFATSPTLVTPNLGTPSAITLTNGTGLPLAGLDASGSRNSTTFLRGDAAWDTISEGGATNAVTICGADPTGVADSTTAINNCLTTYGAVALPQGTYKTTATISVPNGGVLVGPGGQYATISLNSTTANAITVAANAASVRLANLYVTRVGVPTGSAAGIKTDIASIIIQSSFENIHVVGHQIGFYLGPTDYSICRFCISEKNYNDGFYLENNTTWNILQWEMSDVLSQKNDGWGISFVPVSGATNSIQGMPWNGITTYANTNGGIRYVGQSGVPISGIHLNNCVLSYDGNDELRIQAYSGHYNQVHNCTIEGAGVATTGRTLTTAASNLGKGISVLNDVSDLIIDGNVIETNSQYGIGVTGTIASLMISNNQLIRNGVATANTYDGIAVDGTSITKLNVTGNTGLNDLSAAQRYGIAITTAATSTIISGNNMSGATAGCTLSTSAIVYGNSGTGCTGASISSSIASGSAVSITTATTKNITSVSLPAGEWSCWGNVNFYPNAATTISSIGAWISTTSAAVPTRPNAGSFTEITANLITGGNQSISAGQIHLSLGSTTTVYLEAYTTFAVNVMTGGGYIECRRAL